MQDYTDLLLNIWVEFGMGNKAPNLVLGQLFAYLRTAGLIDSKGNLTNQICE